MLPSHRLLAISWASGVLGGTAYAWWAIATQNLPRHTQVILASGIAAYAVLTGVAFLFLAKKQARDEAAKREQRERL